MLTFKDLKVGNLYRIHDRDSSSSAEFCFHLMKEDKINSIITAMPNGSIIMFLDYKFNAYNVHVVRCIYEGQVGIICFSQRDNDWYDIQLTELTQ